MRPIQVGANFQENRGSALILPERVTFSVSELMTKGATQGAIVSPIPLLLLEPQLVADISRHRLMPVEMPTIPKRFSLVMKN